jgi:hypothetical protein
MRPSRAVAARALTLLLLGGFAATDVMGGAPQERNGSAGHAGEDDGGTVHRTDALERTRIPHLDGSGRGTLVEIDPRVPGARDFVREDAARIPSPGEIDRAPTATPGPCPLPRR